MSYAKLKDAKVIRRLEDVNVYNTDFTDCLRVDNNEYVKYKKASR